MTGNLPLLRNIALVSAPALALVGALVLNASPKRSALILENFDIALPWLGAALLLLVFASWERSDAGATQSWPARAAGFWRAHRWELLVFSLIFAFGVFMRVYRFGGQLPPADGLCCEEPINAGVAYRALEGQRPLNFLLTRWGAAGGIAIFGESTFGLRFFFEVMSIMTLGTFYLLLRQLVNRQAALFGFALFAASWWIALRARTASDGIFYAVLLALVLVIALKTRRTIWALAAGVLAGLLSYEYEAFKGVPIIAAVFLALAGARVIALRRPLTLGAAAERSRALAQAAWRPVLIALLAAGIVLVPMIVGTHKGYDLYLSSVHRQERGREGDRLADNWRTQLKLAGQIFLPIGPNEYIASPPRDIADVDALDPVAAWLALAGFAAGIGLAFRTFRGLFALWVVMTIGAATLLLADFRPWKMLVLVPVLITLATILVNDVWTAVARRFRRPGTHALACILVVAGAYSFWWNADKLFNVIGPSENLAAAYDNESSTFYEMCRYLRTRGYENHSVISSNISGMTAAFAVDRSDPRTQVRALGDTIWVCHDLQGSSLPAPEEAWPLRDKPDGRLTMVFVNPEEPVPALLAELAQAYPGLGEPDRTWSGPANRNHFIAFEFEDGEAVVTAGLSGTYTSDSGGSATRVDNLAGLSWAEQPAPVEAPFTVRWQGVVYVEERQTAALQVLGGSEATVRIDGQELYVRSEESEAETFADLLPGWHAIEVVLEQEEPGGGAQLVWTTATGERPLPAEDLFPLLELSGWRHVRSTGLAGGLETQMAHRLDFRPHFSAADAIRPRVLPGDFEPFVTADTWTGVWHVENSAEYLLDIEYRAGTITLVIDGVRVVEGQRFGDTLGHVSARVTLAAGPHTIEILQELDGDTTWVGMTLEARSEGAPAPMRVTPY
jgi:hypothetical protein